MAIQPIRKSPLSGQIALTIVPATKGQFVCNLEANMEGREISTKSAHGQNPRHAIAIALENLAHTFRLEAEKEQNIEWEAVELSKTGDEIKRRFHVILHYERVTEEPSKFDARMNTMMGNSVVENAIYTIIQVDPTLPIEPIVRQYPELEDSDTPEEE